VSDNASTDQTTTVVEEFRQSGMEIVYIRQQNNVGFDANVRTVYNSADTDYVWFMSDDDLPFQGAIHKILSALEDNRPDILRFSVVQPPGGPFRYFTYSEAVRIFSEPLSAIENTIRAPKLSAYVIRKICLDSVNTTFIEGNVGKGFMFVALSISVLGHSTTPRVAVISEALATCDEDYRILPWTPEVYLKMHYAVTHPFVVKNWPDLIDTWKHDGYRNAISLAFSVAVGTLIAAEPAKYREFVAGLEWRARELVRSPRTFGQLCALKLRIAHLWPRLRRFVPFISRSSTVKSE
jgi:glycosyltransferase involved in cell wall biosynthesis